MKTTRRIITLALAIILSLALAIPALAAANDGTIKVTGSGNTEYDVYKIFDITLVEKEENATVYTYKLAAGWTDFTAPGFFDVQNGYAIWKKNTNSVADAAAIAQLARNYVDDKDLTTGISVAVGGSVNVAPGYYLLVPEEGPCGVALVEANAETEVEEKTVAEGQPTVEKQVQEDTTQTYGTFNTTALGETVKFQTTIYAGVNAENYVLHDQMDDHFELTSTAADFEVTRDGNAVAMQNNYNVVLNPSDACGCDFHIVFTDTFCSSLAEDAKIVVRYNAKLVTDVLDENMTGETVDHINKTWLTHTSAAAVAGASETRTQTYMITVNKVDDENPADADPLAGATFVLRDNVGLYYQWDAVNKTINWVDKANATKYTTGEDGVVKFIGVDAENFYLEEIVVPDGYTGTTDVAVSTKGNANAIATVVNTLGQTLPETGGIGTTVFYVAGIVLVLGALAALVIFKRKESSAQ